jgi:hypothetical protein
MNRSVEYLGQFYQPVDYHHDLTRGERSYLSDHGIGEAEFIRMNAVDQSDWQKEAKEAAYDSMRNK